MAKLEEMECTVCRIGDTPLTDEEIRIYLRQVPTWELSKSEDVPKIQRTYQFEDYPSALAFTQKVGEAAEEAGHHPVILTEWGKVTVSWWTHKIHGLHANDFIMAAKIDHLYEEK
jgi:4a-hydroxytetrahydrobiopterin dehydratase